MTRVIALVFSIWIPFQFSRALDLDSLFIQSIGGPEALDSLQAISSLKVVGTASLNGKPGRFTEIFAAPDRFYLELDLEGMVLTQAYDGQTAWQRDHNGRVSELSGFEAKSLLSSIYIESFSYLFQDRLAGGFEYSGGVTREGDAYHEVVFFPLSVDTVTVLYDAETARRRFMISTFDNLRATTEFGDYHRVSGFWYPYLSQTTFEGVPFFTRLEADGMLVNVDYDASLFEMPKERVSDYRFDNALSEFTVPFEYRYGHIWLQAGINGQTCWFILDSGASANILNSHAIKTLNLPVTGSLPVKGLVGYDEVELVRYDSLRIGSLVILDQVAGSLDLEDLRQNLDENRVFGGILGYDFLSRFPLRIDYSDSVLTLYNPARFELPPGGVDVEFRLNMLIPTVTGRVNGVPGDFIIDLGNAYGLLLHKTFVDQHSLDTVLSDIRDNPARLGGIGGGIGGETAFLEEFRIGDIRLDSLRVLLPDTGVGLTGSKEFDGNIGNLILENFIVLFDYDNNRVVLYKEQS